MPMCCIFVIDTGGPGAQWHLSLLAEQRKPSGECRINVAKPEGSRPAATKAQPKVIAIRLTPPAEIY